MAKKKDRLEVRIRYERDWNDQGEHFVFENKWTSEDEWGLDTAFKLLDYDYGNGIEKGAVISYQALTKIRELIKLGISFRFGK